jgi:hypothetical protein
MICYPSFHTQVFMVGDAGDFHDVESALEQVRGGLVAQVVKA